MLFPYHVNHLELNWRVPLHRGAMRFLARRFTVINLDFPGAGLSRPGAGHLSLASLTGAIEAVREAAGVRRLGLVAMGAAGLAACAFAGGYPDRVTKIVLIASGESDANRQLLHLRQQAPEVEAAARGALLGGPGDKQNALALRDVARASIDRPALTRWEALLQHADLLTLAGSVSAPALYFHAAGDTLVPLSAARALVERLEHGALSIVSGTSGMDVWRSRAAVQEIVRFFGPADGRLPLRSRARGGGHPAGLSAREVEVLRLLAGGRTNRQIAEELFVSANTVSHHLRNIFAKTGASNRTEAAAFAFHAGLATRE